MDSTMLKLSHLFAIFSMLFITAFCCDAVLLTNQQINLLVENDDVQIFTPTSKVKKVTLTIEQHSENGKGKTIAEYNKSGLLINYYDVSTFDNAQPVPSDDQSTMIITLMSTEKGKWRRKQTLDQIEIDNSIYTLKDNQIEIEFLPSEGFDERRMIIQHNEPLNDDQGEIIRFSYQTPPEQEQFAMSYQFNQNQLLTEYHFSNADEHENGYISLINRQFTYDKLQRLVNSAETSYSQFMDEPEEKIETQAIYSDYDQFGNWQTKVETSGVERIVYKRVIEYWD